MQTKNKDVVREFEGLRLEAYLDTGGVWTIGYGHTGDDVWPGLTITKGEAESLLTEDLRESEEHVSKLVKVKLTQNQFDALVSFVFNIGGEAFKQSTLLRKLNSSDYEGAANQLLRWVNDNGKVISGLVNRRKLERKLFIGE